MERRSQSVQKYQLLTETNIYTQAAYRVIEVLLEINCPLLEAQLVVKNEKHVNRGLWYHRKRGCELNGVSLASFRDIDMFGLDNISTSNDRVDEVWNLFVRLNIEGDVFAQFGTKKLIIIICSQD